MKKELLIVTAAFFLLSGTAFTSVKAFNQANKNISITEKEWDITGDGKNEIIRLVGVPIEDKKEYLRDIYIEVESTDRESIKIPLDSGAKASFKVVDLNGDGIKDLLANVLTGEKGSETINYLFSYKDFIRKDLTVPDPLAIDSQFVNGYKASITIKEVGKNFVFDLKDRKKYYKKLGLYYKGKLNEPTELTVHTFQSLKPVRLDNGQIGLNGVQRITGITNNDTIAYVESSWNYNNGKWSLVETKVQKENRQNKEK